MTARVFGESSNLKPSQSRALARLQDRRIPADRIISSALARDLLELANELNRRIGLFVDRRGRVERVILGSAHSMQLPEFERVRGAAGRLRGVRLVVAHLLDDPLDREELADLAKLRLDAVAAVHSGAAGIQVDIATLRPGAEAGEAFRLDVHDRRPLRHVAPEDIARLPPPVDGEEPIFPFDDFMRELEGQLVRSSTAAVAQSDGTRAMVLMVATPGMKIEARQNEMRELCRTAGIEVVELVVQRRPHPDPRSFLGSGKLSEVLIRALEQDVEVLICDPELSASQARTIANLTDLSVIDRTMLILDIFAQHASSSDGKLQVELAQLRYRLPKLVGRGTMMSRLAGGIGGRGPGESKLEIDRRRAKDRIADLERRLVHLGRQRDQRRARRDRSQIPVVAIVGYTNAGKSTFLNTVTQSTVRAENKLFATLDPTVRQIRFPRDREVVLLDTVGFIRELPPALMQAFGATLEEVSRADLLLHIVDISDPDHDAQIETVQDILENLDAGDVPRWIVYNKCDRLDHWEAPSRSALKASGAPEADADADVDDESESSGNDAALNAEQSVAPEEHYDASGRRYFRLSALERRSTRQLMEAIEAQLFSGPRSSPGAVSAAPTEDPADGAEAGDEALADEALGGTAT